MIDVAVIGGGAAGFFAAINIKKKHPDLKVHIFEKSKTVLGKVKVSGGGRCNVTHACFEPEKLILYYPRGRKELLSVFRRFNPADTVSWFQEQGIRLKTEADGRMFPVSDDSQTIINCFLQCCTVLDIPVFTNSPVQDLQRREEIFELEIDGKIIRARKVIVSPGGSQHFWQLLAGLGHRIIEPVPSLFTFNIKHPLIHDLMGLSVNPAEVKLVLSKEQLKAYRLKEDDIVQSGPLLVTHWGLSGPAVLKLSSVAARVLHKVGYCFDIQLNLSHQKTEDTFATISSFKESNSKKLIINTPLYQLPSRLWSRLHELTFERPNLNWSDVSKKEMMLLAENLSRFPLSVRGKSTFKEEFVTAGGVDLKEVDFKTMQSKIIPGLYLAGEVLDIDALTGGFNFQAAWSEGWVISEGIYNI
jgi:predicted Rossmann fold flavoprotein